jgi:segregation and condensation protein A
LSYPVKLEVFEGPLDLLLHLVSRERLDVADISISSVTSEYLEATRALGTVDLETASYFLVLAATLLELKSLKLLPRRPVDPEIKLLLEERDRLLHRLIAYSTFKQAARMLGEAWTGNVGYQSRQAEIPTELMGKGPDVLEGLSAQQVASAAARALQAKVDPVVDTSHITPLTVSLEEMVDLLAARIRGLGAGSFRELCSRKSRIEIVVAFLAILDLYRRQSIELEQSQPFAPISVRWREASGS